MLRAPSLARSLRSQLRPIRSLVVAKKHTSKYEITRTTHVRKHVTVQTNHCIYVWFQDCFFRVFFSGFFLLAAPEQVVPAGLVFPHTTYAIIAVFNSLQELPTDSKGRSASCRRSRKLRRRGRSESRACACRQYLIVFRGAFSLGSRADSSTEAVALQQNGAARQPQLGDYRYGGPSPVETNATETIACIQRL